MVVNQINQKKNQPKLYIIPTIIWHYTIMFIRDKTKLYRIWGGDITANKNLEVERETIVSFIFKRVNTLRCYIRVSTTRACHSHL